MLYNYGIITIILHVRLSEPETQCQLKVVAEQHTSTQADLDAVDCLKTEISQLRNINRNKLQLSLVYYKQHCT